MENEQQTHEGQFFIKLYFDNISVYDKDRNPIASAEVNVSDLSLPIEEQIRRIVEVFKLPKINELGQPIEYLLAQPDKEVLEFQDDDRRTRCFLDYNIKSGDKLHLLVDPKGA